MELSFQDGRLEEAISHMEGQSYRNRERQICPLLRGGEWIYTMEKAEHKKR